MLTSMTGFARQTCPTNFGTLSIEIRSVNHRFLEPSFRIPEILRSNEPQLRESLQKKIARGKIDISIRLETESGDAGTLHFNEELAKELIAIHQKANLLLNSNLPFLASDLIRFSNVLTTEAPDPEYLQTKLIELFNKTLNSLIENRQAEGARIELMLKERLVQIKALTDEAKVIRPQALEKLKAKLLQRLQELAIEFDQSRFEQELVLAAQKLDIDEEIDRLYSHIEGMNAVFSRNEPVGRRLDFLTQELNREANTLGSKAQDAELTSIAVDLKVLIEQIREQIQNIE